MSSREASDIIATAFPMVFKNMPAERTLELVCAYERGRAKQLAVNKAASAKKEVSHER